MAQLPREDERVKERAHRYGSRAAPPRDIPVGCAQLLHGERLRSARGFRSRTTLLPHRRRASSWRGGRWGRLRGGHSASPPIPAPAWARQRGQTRAFWPSEAPVRARRHVTQTDPGTSASPRLFSRPCPLRVQSPVSERAAGWDAGAELRAGRAHPALSLSPYPSFSPCLRSARKRRWRRHGGADGSRESHRDGLPQGTRGEGSGPHREPGHRGCNGLVDGARR